MTDRATFLADLPSQGASILPALDANGERTTVQALLDGSSPGAISGAAQDAAASAAAALQSKIESAASAGAALSAEAASAASMGASYIARDQAEAAAQTALMSGPIFADFAAGAAANPAPSEGASFIAYGPEGNYATRYRYTSGSWAAADSYPNRSALDAVGASIRQTGGARQEFKPVQVWTNGLGFIIGERYAELRDPVPVSDVAARTVTNLGFVLSEQRLDGSERRPGGYSRPIVGARQRTINPLGFVTSEELNGGAVRGLGMVSRAITDARYRRVNPLGFVTFEERLDGSLRGMAAAVAPEPEPETPTLPLFTDGRSLTQWRAKAAQILAPGGSGVMRAGFFGNSWHDKLRIVQAAATRLRGHFGDAGAGWISCDSNLTGTGDDLGPLDSATMTQTGWTLFDITSSTTIPTDGCGLDGKLLYTDGATATATLSFAGTAFSLFRRKTSGSLRYSLDGGAPVTLSGDGSNTLDVTTVSGLAPGTHSLVIDAVGNTGRAAWQGVRYWTEGATGVEIYKLGNAGLDSSQLAVYVAQHIAPAVVHFNLDLIVFELGTNDYRRANNNPVAFRATIEAFVAAVRSVLPNVGFIFYAPASSNGTVALPLIQYCDALGALAIEGGHEFYHMHRDWASFATENARSMWRDGLHLNDVGAWRLVSALDHLFFSNRCI